MLIKYLSYVQNLSPIAKSNLSFNDPKTRQNFYLPGVVNPFDSPKKGVFVERNFWCCHAFLIEESSKCSNTRRLKMAGIKSYAMTSHYRNQSKPRLYFISWGKPLVVIVMCADSSWISWAVNTRVESCIKSNG